MSKRSQMWLFIMALALLSVPGYNNCMGPSPGSSTVGGSSSGPSSGTGPTGPPVSAGQTYYTANVLPLFNARCATCHALPVNGGTAPLTIFNYNTIKNTFLSIGPSSVNNNLVNKMQNILAHAGGNVCPQGVSAPPCQQISAWWQTEYGTPGTSAGGITGFLYVDVFGNVTGWAQDTTKTTTAITVYFYVDGPVGMGTAAGSVVANSSNGLVSGHSFSMTLAATFADGKSHMLYAYGENAVASDLIPGMPLSYIAYTPKAAGMTYYNNTLLPLLQNKCMGCHTVNYATQYNDLISPAPSAGGTATNNLLISKPGGLVSHSGGNICGGINGSPCLQIQQWWALEFN